MKKTVNAVFTALFLLILFGFGIWVCLKNPDAISLSERRDLAQKPTVSLGSITDGSVFDDTEAYLLDQFPLRESFRRLKAFSQFYLFGQKENNGIVLDGGQAASLSYRLTEKSVDVFCRRLNALYDTYLAENGCRVYSVLIPDKMAYFGESYPKLDYDALRGKLKSALPGTYIEIGDTLSLSSYFSTDTHWRMDALLPTANRILGAMEAEPVAPTEVAAVLSPFHGVYFGQSALPLPPDEIVLLTNPAIKGAAVKRADPYTGEMKEAKLLYPGNITADDAYDVFLGGACTVIEIDNTLSDNGKALCVFGDSFARALVPLLLSDYDRVIVYDIRYIRASSALHLVPLPAGSDVLLAYNISAIDVADNLRVD